jgi:bifunctional non-homologous end joining protein LigD
LVDRPPAGPGWLHEIKHDGFRVLAWKQGERVTAWSRRGADHAPVLRCGKERPKKVDRNRLTLFLLALRENDCNIGGAIGNDSFEPS